MRNHKFCLGNIPYT